MTTLQLRDLTADEEQIVADFKEKTIVHPHLKTAVQECLLHLKQPVGNPIVLLYGPAGVGKSTVIKEIHKHFFNVHAADMRSDPGFIPVAGVEAVPAEREFKWDDYFHRALVALDEPLIEYKVDYDQRGIQNSGTDVSLLSKRAKLLRQALENALKYRKVRVFTVDEAEHINNMVRGRTIENQLNIIKSLANLSQTVHVLAGSYRILNFRNLDGQLSRRTVNIELPRYKLSIKQDRARFKSVLSQFLRKLNVSDHDAIMKEWQFFYEHSIGCIGTLKDWMTRALTRHLILGDDALELRHFEQTALSASQCLVMAREAIEGEKQLEAEKREKFALKNILRGKEDTSSSTSTPEAKPNSPRRSNNAPGERSPKRDAVGSK